MPCSGRWSALSPGRSEARSSASVDTYPSYPAARRGDEVVEVGGHVVPDPYRWLEQLDSPETRAWVDAQQSLTESVLADAAELRDAIAARLTALWDFPSRSVPSRHGSRWFQWRNAGLQNQPILYVGGSPEDEGRVLLDPNTLSADGTVAVTGATFTEDGRLLAYATSDAGADWMTWHVRDVESGADLPDVVHWSKIAGGAWLADGSGFYYSAYDRPPEGHELVQYSGLLRIRLHRLGTDESEDAVVFERPESAHAMPIATVTEDGRFLVVMLATAGATETALFVQDLRAAQPEWKRLAGDLESFVSLVGVDGDAFFVLTNVGAARRRIVRVQLGDRSREAWREVVPEGEHMLIEARHVGGRLVCQYLRHAAAELAVFGADGALLHRVDVPAGSTVPQISGSADDPLLFFSTTSFTDPGTLWSHDVETGVTSLVRRTEAPLPAQETVTEQVFVDSLDGTKIPVFLVRRADVTPTGEVPVLLTGYGGFNIPLTPGFSVPQQVWIERGGLLAVATLRGGGEYGAEWHDAGRLANKQNVFDDFMSVARWLHGSGWSKPARIAIQGGSNGGLLVGAALVQQPELFGAVVCEVGVLDMLRFHTFTLGPVWNSEYGDPDDPQAFETLARYSPVHNVRPGLSYPPTLITTGDHDDRVVPCHSFKFGAALQHAQAGPAPVLLRIEKAAGHGQGKPIAKVIEARAEVLAFVERALSQ
ncbi:MAG TPA: prolyl oligopeptidase family serine peptidase [Gaiellaceae bacterium]|nr:prolyl oligopeptidase family serine peptidase [Gaiellaceae bacterium]